jgi:mono/diheme cytochrome c family protein
MKIKLFGLVLASSVLLLSCSDEAKEKAVATTQEKQIIKRDINPVHFSQGQKLYQANCAQCHGKYAEGEKNWRSPDKDGKYLAPPLNGSAHTWHHSSKALTNVIRNGTAKIGGNMPAWKEKLSDSEIKLILTWIKAQWSDEIYTAWYNRFHKEK